jgi:hypothetical protein
MNMLEALIRRLYISGYLGFYVVDPDVPRRDTNIMAWIEDSTAALGVRSADLVAKSGEGRYRHYLVVGGPQELTSAAGAARIRNLREEILRRNENPDETLRIAIHQAPSTVPDPLPRHTLRFEWPHPYAIEALSTEPADVALDYLRMSRLNIFNSSNTPVSVRIIADGLGVSTEQADRACQDLLRRRLVEVVPVGSNRFYRVSR